MMDEDRTVTPVFLNFFAVNIVFFRFFKISLLLSLLSSFALKFPFLLSWFVTDSLVSAWNEGEEKSQSGCLKVFRCTFNETKKTSVSGSVKPSLSVASAHIYRIK